MDDKQSRSDQRSVISKTERKDPQSMTSKTIQTCLRRTLRQTADWISQHQQESWKVVCIGIPNSVKELVTQTGLIYVTSTHRKTWQTGNHSNTSKKGE